MSFFPEDELLIDLDNMHCYHKGKRIRYLLERSDIRDFIYRSSLCRKAKEIHDCIGYGFVLIEHDKVYYVINMASASPKLVQSIVCCLFKHNIKPTKSIDGDVYKIKAELGELN